MIHLCEAEASDSMPPSVEADGLGRRAAARVPLEILLALVASVEQLAAESERSAHAGCAAVGVPVS